MNHDKYTNNFCTLFDANYLIRGLALYNSLEKFANDFHLYILALDDKSAKILKYLDLKNATIVTLSEFEDKELLSVKKDRSNAEYYWTCTPSLILYCLNKFNLNMCTYIDADLLFFDSPSILLNELGPNNSILITEHRYSPGEDRTHKYGKYCVQFNAFKNNETGLKALKWWRDSCIKWCYIRIEDRKFGDQKYLDDWLERFSGVRELHNLGGGVAPWNVKRYDFLEKSEKVFGKEKDTGIEFPLIFYHFHRTDIYKILGQIKVKSYFDINKDNQLRKLIYEPYEKALKEAENLIKNTGFPLKIKYESNFLYLKESLREVIPRPIKKLIKTVYN